MGLARMDLESITAGGRGSFSEITPSKQRKTIVGRNIFSTHVVYCMVRSCILTIVVHELQKFVQRIFSENHFGCTFIITGIINNLFIRIKWLQVTREFSKKKYR